MGQWRMLEILDSRVLAMGLVAAVTLFILVPFWRAEHKRRKNTRR